MREFLKKIPFPVSGLMLGCISLSNLLNGNSFFATAATFFFLLLTAKLVFCWQDCREQLKHPVTASVCGTYSMSLMLLSVYYQAYLGQIAEVIWFMAIALHLLIAFYFSRVILPQVRPSQFHATFFIVYVGIAVAALTSPAYQAEALGQIFWIIALVSFVVLAVFMAYRYLLHGKQNPVHLKPLVGVFAAPASLCLTSYLQSFDSLNPAIIFSLLIMSILIYSLIIVQIPCLIKKTFYPSYAALTFPLIISAAASSKVVD
ncbi:MAG: TDT family transporter, partial [Clostridia bacterium]|nr:TDT family transporter [Clostridia bacterium]